MLSNLFNADRPSTDVASYSNRIEKAQNVRVEQIMKFFKKEHSIRKNPPIWRVFILCIILAFCKNKSHRSFSAASR